MTVPLLVLGVLTVLIGFVNTPFRLSFEHFLAPAFEGVGLLHAPEDGFLLTALALVSTAAGVVGSPSPTWSTTMLPRTPGSGSSAGCGAR